MICHKYNTTCTAVHNLYSKIYTSKVSSKIAAKEEIYKCKWININIKREYVFKN